MVQIAVQLSVTRIFYFLDLILFVKISCYVLFFLVTLQRPQCAVIRNPSLKQSYRCGLPYKIAFSNASKSY